MDTVYRPADIVRSYTSLEADVTIQADGAWAGRNTLRNAEWRPRVLCGIFDAEKTCGMWYNLRNKKMRISHVVVRAGGGV